MDVRKRNKRRVLSSGRKKESMRKTFSVVHFAIGFKDRAAAKYFGDFSPIGIPQVGTSDWQTSEELGSTWQSRNAFSYGHGEAGVSRPEARACLWGPQRLPNAGLDLDQPGTGR